MADLDEAVPPGVFEDSQFINRLVKIVGLEGPILPRAIGSQDDPLPVEANGLCGRAVDWLDDTGTFLVFTFDALFLEVAEENLQLYEVPTPSEGGFDTAMPFTVEAFFDFCASVNNILTTKHWCLIQAFKSEESREEALTKAKRKDFEVPRDEFLVDFIGRKGKGKVSYVNPLDLMDEEEAATVAEPQNDFERYDSDITSLFQIMGPMSWDTMGFHSSGRTESMVWLPFAGSREENALAPGPLTDDDIDEGLVERHIQFLRRRKLCYLYFVDTEGGTLTLQPRSDIKMETVTIPVKKGRILVYRCDLMTYSYTPSGQHMTMQSWILEAPPKIELGDIVANETNLTEALGIVKGPVVPQGSRAHIMAGCCLTGGGTWSLEQAGAMYMSATDAHVYVPNSRFDTDIYFTKNGDVDLIPFANSYHHHGGLCNDAEVMSFDNAFFGYSEWEASLLQPAQHKTLEVGYETLYRAGFTKKTVNNQPILIYVGDCGSEWWNYLLTRQMQGQHLGPEGRMQWEEGRNMCITGQRLSYNLNLRGPTWTCDTACSSGLTAFCTAMYSIKKPTVRGTESPSVDPHCLGALAGGTNMVSDAGVYIGASGQHMLSLKGRCFTYDTSGDGYARGEGTSMCYVMISNNDRDTEMQEACAIGNKVNQDGRSASMTAPNGPSQQLCIKASLREAGVMPHDITASECHGTGTSLGDPIEVGSLRGVQETDERDDPIYLSSSKSNIGHLEANAGTTGLFKCILMSKYGLGLPNCHLRSLNPHLEVSGWPTYMISEGSNYSQQSGLVGVSSFGVSGTNSHAEVWAHCRFGPNKCGRQKLNYDAIKQISVTCPVTLAPIDHLTGEPALTDGRTRKVDCLREELASYDISSAVYEGGFRFRAEALDDEEDLVNTSGVEVTINGSWTGFNEFEPMVEEEDGSFSFNMVLGDSRCESFIICLNKSSYTKFWPVCKNAAQHVHIEGPDHSTLSKGKRWLVDGRDGKVPAGTVYQIKFYWGTKRKRVTWEEVSPEMAPSVFRSRHVYYITGSWTSGRMDNLVRIKDEDGIYEYVGKIGVTGSETFQLCRDADEQQTIYPSEPNATDTTVPVRGPDDLGAGKYWLINGTAGENFWVRLEVSDGQVLVSVRSRAGEKVYESMEGWERHTYWLCFQSGIRTQMVMDPDAPGVFRARGEIGQNFDYKYRGFCEMFNIIVDEDMNQGLFPDVAYASSGECIVWGPEPGPTAKPFMIKSWQIGAGFEVVLDMRAKDRRQIVTWTWDTHPQYTFEAGQALLDA